MRTKPSSRGSSFYIRRISVEKLFGQYTYDLQVKAATGIDPSKLLILYGDNGSGKTTLLRLIFNLLAHARGRGHKTFVAGTSFRRLVVELGNETAVVAQRSAGNLKGGFRMLVRRAGKTVSEINWVVDEQGVVKARLQDQQRQERVLKSLEELDIGLYFLADDRTITSNLYSERERSEEISELEEGEIRAWTRVHGRLLGELERPEGTLREVSLQRAIYSFANWVTGQALRGSTKGDADANAIYTDIIQRVAKVTTKARPDRHRPGIKQLIGALQEEAARSHAFSRFGLTSPLNVGELISSIKKARSGALPTIEGVLKAYVDGVKARLDALQQIHDSIAAFVNSINTFYRNKEVAFDLRKGLSILTPSGAVLPPQALSSGERQVLLLFCNVLVARDRNSVFVIDEPELSLNVKWQRELVRTLLDFTRGSKIQFLLATHSFELLARHRRYVVKLVENQ